MGHDARKRHKENQRTLHIMSAIPFSNLAEQEKILREKISTLPSESTRNLVINALEFAKAAHVGQMRDEGAPYAIHPIRACSSLFDVTQDPEILAAMLLHDVIEDTSHTVETLEKEFTFRVAELVENLTRPRPSQETDDEKKK